LCFVRNSPVEEPGRAIRQNENPARGHWAGVSGTLMQGGLGELSEGSLGKHMGAPEAA